VSVDGRWHPQIKELPDVRMEPDFAGFVSKKDDAMFHTLKSELSREGNYSLYVDGKLAARTRVQSAKPLELTSDFVGTNVPTVLPRGMAGAVIDNSYRARSVAGDLTLSPAR